MRAGRRRCIGEKLRAGDTVLMDTPLGPAAREAAPARGRGARARGGARHLLRRRRRPRRARSSRSPTRSSCRSCTTSCSREHKLPAPKGILLYGPPGLRQDAHRQGGRQLARQEGGRGDRRHARPAATSSTSRAPSCSTSTSARPSARSASSSSGPGRSREEGWPVIVFFDEMDSLFRTRGTGICSDMESTIVPQLLAEIDGVETLKNVIVIGASNREDLIDPAILRPGPPRREDQDRAARRGGGGADLRAATSPPTCRSTDDEVDDARRRRPGQGRAAR